MFLGQDLARIADLPVSELEGVFETETFKSWKKARDRAMAVPGVVIARMDAMAKQLAAMHKALTPR